ncbi:MAG: hypothetical protein ACI31V_02015 [Bacilli bacterium]
MKKFTLLLTIICIMFITGCTMVRIDTGNIDNIVNVVLSKENVLYNHIGKGYKYYIPRGVTYIDTIEFNDKLYSNGNYYYLYIDAISYYYQKEIKHSKSSDSYYYKDININNKGGYIDIQQVEDKYLIDFMYNYAHVQSLVKKEDINEVILNSSYILSTVKFNNNVIRIMLNEDYFKYKEEKFQLFEEEKKNDNFLEYNG